MAWGCLKLITTIYQIVRNVKSQRPEIWYTEAFSLCEWYPFPNFTVYSIWIGTYIHTCQHTHNTHTHTQTYLQSTEDTDFSTLSAETCLDIPAPQHLQGKKNTHHVTVMWQSCDHGLLCRRVHLKNVRQSHSQDTWSSGQSLTHPLFT